MLVPFAERNFLLTMTILILCYAVYKLYKAYQKGKRICDIQDSIDKMSHFYSILDDKRRRPGPALRSAIDKLEWAKKKSYFGILLTLVGVDILDDINDILCGIQDAIEGSEIVLDPSLDVEWEKYIMKFFKRSAGKIQLRKTASSLVISDSCILYSFCSLTSINFPQQN